MNVILEELNYIMLEEVLQNSARGVIEQCVGYRNLAPMGIGSIPD